MDTRLLSKEKIRIIVEKDNFSSNELWLNPHEKFFYQLTILATEASRVSQREREKLTSLNDDLWRGLNDL